MHRNMNVVRPKEPAASIEDVIDGDSRARAPSRFTSNANQSSVHTPDQSSGGNRQKPRESWVIDLLLHSFRSSCPSDVNKQQIDDDGMR